ncbi:MAG: iron-sulfur cluster assembly accessory protein [archaeon]
MVENKKKITVDMNIGDLVSKYPSAARLLLDAGVHCIGCHAAHFETLGEGLQNHGLSEEEINDLLSRMNKVAEEDEKALGEMLGKPEELLVSPRAIEELKKKNVDNKYVRIEVGLGGCSGFNYTLSLDDEASDNDQVIEISDVKFVVAKESFGMIAGTKLDYLEEEQGFCFTGPSSGCRGC